jgi:hypothetical protein
MDEKHFNLIAELNEKEMHKISDLIFYSKTLEHVGQLHGGLMDYVIKRNSSISIGWMGELRGKLRLDEFLEMPSKTYFHRNQLKIFYNEAKGTFN